MNPYVCFSGVVSIYYSQLSRAFENIDVFNAGAYTAPNLASGITYADIERLMEPFSGLCSTVPNHGLWLAEKNPEAPEYQDPYSLGINTISEYFDLDAYYLLNSMDITECRRETDACAKSGTAAGFPTLSTVGLSGLHNSEVVIRHTNQQQSRGNCREVNFLFESNTGVVEKGPESPIQTASGNVDPLFCTFSQRRMIQRAPREKVRRYGGHPSS
jgi:hypothetical protein